MKIQLSPEQEGQFSRMASHQGKDPEELAKDVLLGMLEENERFLAAVQVGIDQADRGEFVEHGEVKKRIGRLLGQQ